MGSPNRLKLGLFGANCSSGRAVTMVPERWSGSWPDCLNLVCGWNEGEFEMFGATLRDHEVRYEYAQEWLDIIKLAWSPHEDFDFDGHFFIQGRAGQAQTLWRDASV